MLSAGLGVRGSRRHNHWRCVWLAGACFIVWSASVSTQEVLDRVLARVNGEPITLTDARAAIALGVVEPAPGVDPIVSTVLQLIERRLVLAEVARFAPPEPDIAAMNAQVNTLKSRVGGPQQLAALEKSTGVGDTRIREIARDTLRIQAYLNQRFGASVQASDEDAAAYYRAHLDEFRLEGKLVPYTEAAPLARQRASEERRRAMIFQWMRELRQRADVVENYKQ
jgi:hypothetical protein